MLPGCLEVHEMAQIRLSEAAKKRLHAGRLLQAGRSCAEVALAVGVARQTVFTWKRLLGEGGLDALRCVRERGRPARLNQAQLATVRAAMKRSPTEHGFSSDLWTLKRAGALIETIHGVSFGQTQVWRILGRLGFNVKDPVKRTAERSHVIARVRKL